MKKRTRIISLILALVMALSLVACTAKQETGTTKEKEPTASNEPAKKDEPAAKKDTEEKKEPAETTKDEPAEPVSKEIDRSEKVTLTIGLGKRADVSDYDDNRLTQWLEESCNVDIEFVFYNGSEIATQIATQIAANEKLPDIFYGIDLPRETYLGYTADGYFVNMAQWLKDEEFMANYDILEWMEKDFTQQTIEAYWKSVTNTDDGGIYQLARYAESVIDGDYVMCHINKTWLDQLGLDIPTDFESFVNCLIAFRDNDPNGNGLADEIPFIGNAVFTNNMTAWFDPLLWVINAFVYDNEVHVFNADEDGNLYIPTMTDEYREALRSIKYLVDEGLLSTTSFTMQSKAEFAPTVNAEDGVLRVGCYCGHSSNIDDKKSDIPYNYVSIAPFTYAPYCMNFTLCSAISSECEHPDRAMDILLHLLSREGELRQLNGVPEEDWTEVKDEADGNIKLKVLNPDAFRGNTNRTWGLGGLTVMSRTTPYFTTTPEYKEPATEMGYNDYFTWDSAQYRIAYEEKNVQNTPANQPYVIPLSVAQAEEVGSMKQELFDYVRQARAEFCTGIKDIDNDAHWNAYLEACRTIGADELVRIYQEAYNAN